MDRDRENRDRRVPKEEELLVLKLVSNSAVCEVIQVYPYDPRGGGGSNGTESTDDR